MGHHYLPQRLLQGFSEGGRNVWAIDLKAGTPAKCLPIKGIANEPKMNLPSIESRLSEEIEGPFNKLFPAIADRRVLTKDDIAVIARYLLAMYRRVPAGRARSAAAVPHVARAKEREDLERIDSLERLIPHEAASAEAGRRNIREIYERINKGDPTWIWQQTLMPENLPNAINLLKQMTWACLAVPAGRQLLIGDAPVLFDESKGLAHRNAELVFPITSSTLLAGTWRVGPPWSYGTVTVQQVRAINEWMVKAADRWVFARRDEGWVLPMAARLRRSNSTS